MATIVDYDGPSVSKSEVSHGGEGQIIAKCSRLCHLGSCGEAHAQDLVVRREACLGRLIILVGSARGRCGVSWRLSFVQWIDDQPSLANNRRRKIVVVVVLVVTVVVVAVVVVVVVVVWW